MIQGAAFRILACFYDKDSGNFADLCERAGYPTDLGGYYTRQLVKAGYLQKTDRGVYHISPKGKQDLAFRYGKRWFGLQPRLGVALVARQAESVVLLRRKVQPFIGVAEWPAGVVRAGETVEQAAKRMLQSRLGLETPPKLLGFFRRIDMYQGVVFDDKLFAVHTTEIPAKSRLMPANELGENVLCDISELRRLEKPSRALLDIYKFAETGGGQLMERTYQLTAADLSLPGQAEQ